MFVGPGGFTELHKHKQVSPEPTRWALQGRQAGLTRTGALCQVLCWWLREEWAADRGSSEEEESQRAGGGSVQGSQGTRRGGGRSDGQECWRDQQAEGEQG